ncbi:hypothetical protein JCM19233_7078 [Vibrio astriarenae]|nr:hypothetical protein JCM19233_7078 [Vibrio sp. C7]
MTGEKTACGQAIRETNGIKAGEFERNAELLSKAIVQFVEQGVTSVILGCTELPLVRESLKQRFPNISFIDPMEAVAERVVGLYQSAQERVDLLDTEGQLHSPLDIHSDEEIVDYIVSRA